MNKPKAKGTAAETAVVRWFREHGFPHSDRQPLRGNRDAGDIALTAGVVLEVKAHRTAAAGQPGPMQLAEWMAQAALERYNAGAAHCPLIVKRAGTADVGRWFAYLPLAELVVLTGGPDTTRTAPVCLTVAALATLLRDAGYGATINFEESA